MTEQAPEFRTAYTKIKPLIQHIRGQARLLPKGNSVVLHGHVLPVEAVQELRNRLAAELQTLRHLPQEATMMKIHDIHFSAEDEFTKTVLEKRTGIIYE